MAIDVSKLCKVLTVSGGFDPIFLICDLLPRLPSATYYKNIVQFKIRNIPSHCEQVQGYVLSLFPAIAELVHPERLSVSHLSDQRSRHKLRRHDLVLRGCNPDQRAQRPRFCKYLLL